MNKVSLSTLQKISWLTALALIIFFLAMKFLNLVTVVEFRFVNFFIILFAVRYVLLEKRKENNGKLEYLGGMLTGFLTALFSSVYFALFVFLYLSILDKGLMQYIQETQPFGNYLTPLSSAAIVVIEGVVSGAILTFSMMHLFNRDSNQG
jgi:hypothetical protein